MAVSPKLPRKSAQGLDGISQESSGSPYPGYGEAYEGRGESSGSTTVVCCDSDMICYVVIIYCIYFMIYDSYDSYMAYAQLKTLPNTGF